MRTAQTKAAQHSAAQRSTAQHSAAQRSAAEHSTFDRSGREQQEYTALLIDLKGVLCCVLHWQDMYIAQTQRNNSVLANVCA